MSTETKATTSFKTYALLSHLDSTAPIYNRVNSEQRIRITKIPNWDPYLQITFTEKDGKNRTIRYKGNTNLIDQSEQIKIGVLANERYTSSERNDLKFHNGFLITKKLSAQTYLEAYPGFEDIWYDGICDQVKQPMYKVVDEKAEIKLSNELFKKTLAAGNKIAAMSLKETQDLLLFLNGSFFPVTDDLEKNTDLLIEFLNGAEEEGLDAILNGAGTIDDETTILIGRLVAAGSLVFDEMSGAITKKKGAKFLEVRNIVADSLEERKRLFSDYLNTEDGKTLKQDLQKDLKALDEKEK